MCVMDFITNRGDLFHEVSSSSSFQMSTQFTVSRKEKNITFDSNNFLFKKNVDG
jgi:hypothetical protein